MTELQLLRSGNSDLQWFQHNYKMLKQNYSDQFVAIGDGKVVSSGKTLDSVLAKLKERGINTNNVLIEFISTIAVIL